MHSIAARLIAAAGAIVLLLAAPADAAPPQERTHYPAAGMAPAGVAMPAGMGPPFSAAVRAGDTLYIAGTTDHDPATGKPATTPEASAKIVLDAIGKTVARAGMTMDDLVWVQIFCTDLSEFDRFNAVYRTYFHGPMPARAFLGVDHLLGNAHFEVMGIAVAGKR